MKTSTAPRRVLLKALLAFICLAHVQGCALVPRDGPSTGDITDASQAGKNQPNYIIVDLTPAVSGTVKAYHDRIPALNFNSLPAAKPVGRIGPGDVLHITIWEANAQQGGVFAQQHGADMMAVVDDGGNISVPYAGRFGISDLALSEIETEIARRLQGKAYAPQVSVQLAENVSNTVFLQGEIGHPGRFPLTPGGDRLLDLIALAGGPRLQPHETMIQVVRGGKSVSTDLYRIMSEPDLDIPLSPGDSVVLTRRLDMFYAFGAVGHTGQLPFSEHTTTLLQAMGAISGLEDDRADPKGVFIFRREPADLAGMIATSKIPETPGAEIEVVYRLDMRNPNSFFLLDAFPVRPLDIIYVSNAPMREYQKVLDSVIGTTGNLVNTGLAAATLSKQ